MAIYSRPHRTHTTTTGERVCLLEITSMNEILPFLFVCYSKPLGMMPLPLRLMATRIVMVMMMMLLLVVMVRKLTGLL